MDRRVRESKSIKVCSVLRSYNSQRPGGFEGRNEPPSPPAYLPRGRTQGNGDRAATNSAQPYQRVPQSGREYLVGQKRKRQEDFDTQVGNWEGSRDRKRRPSVPYGNFMK